MPTLPENSTKLNNLEPKKKTFLEALKKNFGVVSKACDIVGINRTTYYNWLKSDELFKNEVENIDEYILDFVESKLLKNISDGNTAEILFYLKTKGKKRGYVEKIEQSIDMNVNKPIIIDWIGDDKDTTDKETT